MSVKGIFQILIGTMVILALTSVLVEFFNVIITTMQLTQITKMAAIQACELFSQETYKSTDEGVNTGATLKTADIRAANGKAYLSGNFYGEQFAGEDMKDVDKQREVYNKIYTSEDFKSFLSSEAAKKGRWMTVACIADALKVSYPGMNVTKAEQEMGKAFNETLVTPINMGVPYMDYAVTNKMFRWNLTQLLSNCDSDLIQTDQFNQEFINFKGFRIYAKDSYIEKFDYQVYDLNDSSDSKKFTEITGIMDKSFGGASAGLRIGNTTNMADGWGEERSRICIVGINYNVVVAYEGITPIRRIFNAVWGVNDTDNKGNELTNDRGSANGGVAGWTSENGTKSARDRQLAWNEATSNLRSGGIDGQTGMSHIMPVSGKCVYYIVR